MSAEPLPVSPEARPPRRSAPVNQRSGAKLALVPPSVGARRAPFVVLLLVLLAGGLVGLLLLNTASAQDAFRLHSLQSQQAALEQQQQAYTSTADGLDDPARLAARAAALGLVPGGTPAFLRPGQPLPKGAIRRGDLVYVPGAAPVLPPPAPVVSTPVTKPVAKKRVVTKPVVHATPPSTAKRTTTGATKLTTPLTRPTSKTPLTRPTNKTPGVTAPRTNPVPKTAVAPATAAKPTKPTKPATAGGR